MIKTSIITDELTDDFEKALRIAKNEGLDAVEIRTVWGKHIDKMSDAEFSEIKNLLNKYNFSVSCISSRIYKCKSQEADLQEFIINRVIKFAELVESKLLRCFTFIDQNNFVNEEPKLILFIKKLAVLCEKSNIDLIIETEHSCNLKTGKQISDFIKKINNSNIGILWDAGNIAYCGENVVQDLQDVCSYVKHIHIKDFNYNDRKWEIIFAGDIDFNVVFDMLKKQNYTNFVSVETHTIENNSNKESASLKNIRLLKENLNREAIYEN